jgi:vacuolar-type H+-ATPase subunit I/STV1
MFNSTGATAVAVVVGSSIGAGITALAVEGLKNLYNDYDIDFAVDDALRSLHFSYANQVFFQKNINVILPAALLTVTVTVAAISNVALGFLAASITAGVIILPLAAYGAHTWIADYVEKQKQSVVDGSVTEKDASLTAEKKADDAKIATEALEAAKREVEQLKAEKKALETSLTSERKKHEGAVDAIKQEAINKIATEKKFERKISDAKQVSAEALAALKNDTDKLIASERKEFEIKLAAEKKANETKKITKEQAMAYNKWVCEEELSLTDRIVALEVMSNHFKKQSELMFAKLPSNDSPEYASVFKDYQLEHSMIDKADKKRARLEEERKVLKDDNWLLFPDLRSETIRAEINNINDYLYLLNTQ